VAFAFMADSLGERAEVAAAEIPGAAVMTDAVAARAADRMKSRLCTVDIR